ncbi:MAG: superoxide dismutase [Armatimonadetes bacterium]|nr:superoxide dismutase [Armatimonadota bacterium]
MTEHQLPELPYPASALEPTIATHIMELHHDKHHATYVTNLNNALKEYPDLQSKSAEQLIKDLDAVPDAIKAAVRNNGGGHVNHTLFWEIMKPGGATDPSGELLAAIQTAFGSLDELKTKVNDAGAKQFGSGWTWLVSDATGTLEVVSTPNQDSPLTTGKTPILGNDVWEHAYYLQYENRRPEYLKAWWNVVNWDVVAEKYAAAKIA